MCRNCYAPSANGTRETSFFDETALRSFSQSTSALLWGMAGDRGNAGNPEVLLLLFYPGECQ